MSDDVQKRKKKKRVEWLFYFFIFIFYFLLYDEGSRGRRNIDFGPPRLRLRRRLRMVYDRRPFEKTFIFALILCTADILYSEINCFFFFFKRYMYIYIYEPAEERTSYRENTHVCGDGGRRTQKTNIRRPMRIILNSPKAKDVYDFNVT